MHAFYFVLNKIPYKFLHAMLIFWDNLCIWSTLDTLHFSLDYVLEQNVRIQHYRGVIIQLYHVSCLIKEAHEPQNDQRAQIA